MNAKLTFRGRKETAPHGYTIVEPTAAELAKAPASNPKRMSCNTCGKRIWCSGLGIGAHERSVFHRTADGAMPSTPAAPVTEQPKPTAPAGPEVLMAAIASMAERMASSTHRTGAAAATGGDYRKHLDACTRQRKAMYRLMDALANVQGASYGPSWRFRNAVMTVDEHKRLIAKREKSS